LVDLEHLRGASGTGEQTEATLVCTSWRPAAEDSAVAETLSQDQMRNGCLQHFI
jgi:hypothetical protein